MNGTFPNIISYLKLYSLCTDVLMQKLCDLILSILFQIYKLCLNIDCSPDWKFQIDWFSSMMNFFPGQVSTSPGLSSLNSTLYHLELDCIGYRIIQTVMQWLSHPRYLHTLDLSGLENVCCNTLANTACTQSKLMGFVWAIDYRPWIHTIASQTWLG